MPAHTAPSKALLPHLCAVPAGVQPALEYAVGVGAGVAAAAHARLQGRQGSGRGLIGRWVGCWALRFTDPATLQLAQMQVSRVISGWRACRNPCKRLLCVGRPVACLFPSPPSAAAASSHLAEVWAGGAAVAIAPWVTPLCLLPLQTKHSVIGGRCEEQYRVPAHAGGECTSQMVKVTAAAAGR